MHAPEFKWRAVTLHYAYNIPCERVAHIFGVSGRTVRRWCAQFKACGHVMPGRRSAKTPHTPELVSFVSAYVKSHPCFYVEELQRALRERFGELRTELSVSTILRMLKFDLKLSRKMLERRARETVPQEIEMFTAMMRCWYRYPEQLLFLDETSKNGLDSMRRVSPYWRDATCVASWLRGLDDNARYLHEKDIPSRLRGEHHEATEPLTPSQSILVLDNARIHMYAELEGAVHAYGAILLFLLPYCPQYSPIEVMFGQLKRWLASHANLTFPLYPEQVLEIAMRSCLKSEDVGVNLFRHCGYGGAGLNDAVFAVDLDAMGGEME